MESQRNNLSTGLMVIAGVVGAIMGFLLVRLLTWIFGSTWGIICAIFVLVVVAYTLYKVIIE